MLLVGKADVLINCSKRNYDRDFLVQEAKDRWYFSENKIKMLYLAAVLAINANGVLSVTK
jgi:hypothetical protein